jgi:hypothetical protein
MKGTTPAGKHGRYGKHNCPKEKSLEMTDPSGKYRPETWREPWPVGK